MSAAELLSITIFS